MAGRSEGPIGLSMKPVANAGIWKARELIDEIGGCQFAKDEPTLATGVKPRVERDAKSDGAEACAVGDEGHGLPG